MATRTAEQLSSVLSPLFFLKAPEGLSAQRSAALRDNAARLVGHVDLAPTVADLLGGRPQAGAVFTGHSLVQPVPEQRMLLAAATNGWRQWPRAALAVSQGEGRLLCDDADLCRMSVSRGSTARGSRPATPRDALFRAALEDPVMRSNLAQIYRDHYR